MPFAFKGIALAAGPQISRLRGAPLPHSLFFGLGGGGCSYSRAHAEQEENRGSAQKIAWRSRSETERYPWTFSVSASDLPKGLRVASDWLSQFT
jgi:hypothetical protein